MKFVTMTDEQQAAVSTPGSLAVIASAGTGKTTVLTQRFLYCHLKRDAPLHQLLAFTFTEKASREMMTRILESQEIPYTQAPLLNISTIHSFCQRLLKQHGSCLGLSPDFEVYDEDSHNVWQEMMTSQYVSNALEKGNECVVNFIRCYGYTNLKTTIRQLLRKDLGSLKPEELVCISEEGLGDEHTNSSPQSGIPSAGRNHELMTGFIKALACFQQELLAHKISHQIVSYDDLEILTGRLFDEQRHILQKVQGQYRHILVDEYQDISPRQFALISKLFNPERNELFIVGDPKQSIYGFRGAEVGLFYDTVKLIEDQGGQVIYLTTTFRTPNQLQRYFNRVFPLVLSGKDFQPARTTKIDEEALLYAAPVPADIKVTAARHEHYANKIAGIAHDRIKAGTRPEEIAVLFYTALPIPIYQTALHERGIKTVTRTSTAVFEVPVVLVAWQIMKYLCGDRDRLTQVGLLRNEIFSFSESFIDHIVKSQGTDCFCGQTVDLFSQTHDLAQWHRLITWLAKWQDLSRVLFVSELFQTIVSDLRENLSVYESYFVQNVARLLVSWQKEGMFYLTQVAKPLRTVLTKDALALSVPAHPEGVQLLTIHGAKGLEFEHVFLVPGRGKNRETPICLQDPGRGFVFKKHDCENEKMLSYQTEVTPAYERADEVWRHKEALELTRLVYVALTRASRCLYFFVEKPSQSLLSRFA
ncbi:MAG TPA: ATP-dependent helicase, partial [bacterium]|nr:ATP-dependent helicase [bacterium]